MPALSSTLVALIVFGGFGLVIAVLVVVGLVAAYRFSQNNAAAWRELAARTGLTAQRYGVDGNYRDHPVSLSYYGNRGRSYLHLVITVKNPRGIFFELSRQYEGALDSKLQAGLHGPDVRIGDDELDGRFIIESRPESFAQHLFNSLDLRQKILQARQGFRIELEEGRLSFVLQAIVTDPDELVAILNLMSDIAQAVDTFPG